MDKEYVIEESELAKLKRELSQLENQLLELTSQKITKEKLIQDYNFKFYAELGDLLKEVAALRLEKLKREAQTGYVNEKEVNQAQKEYEEFNQEFEEIKSKQVFHLSDKDQESLKKKYKKASRLCHPNIIADEFETEATKIFIELKKAYDTNDLKKVIEILDFLEKNKFPKKSDAVSDKDRLIMAIGYLKIKIQKVKEEIAEIEESDIYKQISLIYDWDTYISHIKKQLEKEAAVLKKILTRAKHNELRKE